MKFNIFQKRLIFFVLLVFPMVWAQAQSYTTSSYHAFRSDDKCDSVIVRSWDDTAIFTCSHHPNNALYSHIFHMRQSTAAHPKVVGLPVMTNYYGAVIDKINDMRLLDKECYFCGTRLKPIGYDTVYDPMGNPTYIYLYDTVAFMGHYSFDGALDITGNIQIHEIPEAKLALRMAVYYSLYGSLDTCAELVCSCSIGSHTTCLVEMKASTMAPTTWDYNVVVPQRTDVVLSDVVVSDDLLVVASFFNNNYDKIGMNYSKLSTYPFSVPILLPSTIDDMCVLNTGAYEGTYFPNGFRRMNNDPIRLCKRPFGLFLGMSGTPNNPGQGGTPVGDFVFVFDMEGPCAIREFQASLTFDSLHFKEMAYLQQKNAAAILFSSRESVGSDSVYTFLQFPRMGAVPVGGIYNDTLLYNGIGGLHSVDAYRGHSAALGGFKWTGCIPLDAIQRQYNRSNSCLTYGGVQPIVRDKVMVSEDYKCRWTIYVKDVESEPIVVSPLSSGNLAYVCSH